MKVIANRIELLDVIGIEEKRVLELGVFKGEFTAELFKRKPEALFLVDTWRAQPAMQYYDEANVSQEDFDKILESVHARYGLSDNVHIIRELSSNAVRQFHNQNLDVVWVDANHSFGHCYHDLVAWGLRVKPGGHLLVHDYGGGSCFYGVRQAVIEYCKVTGAELVAETQDMWSTAAIQIK